MSPENRDRKYGSERLMVFYNTNTQFKKNQRTGIVVVDKTKHTSTMIDMEVPLDY